MVGDGMVVLVMTIMMMVAVMVVVLMIGVAAVVMMEATTTCNGIFIGAITVIVTSSITCVAPFVYFQFHCSRDDYDEY